MILGTPIWTHDQPELAQQGTCAMQGCCGFGSAPVHLLLKVSLTCESPIAISAMESRLYMKKLAVEVLLQMTIPNRVKEMRTTRGWTQEDLAAAVGVSRQHSCAPLTNYFKWRKHEHHGVWQGCR